VVEPKLLRSNALVVVEPKRLRSNALVRNQ
jgi:hypothetical protein